MARTISIILTLVIGISLVALVAGQDSSSSTTRPAETGIVAPKDDSYQLPPPGATISVLQDDTDTFPAPATLPQTIEQSSAPIIGQPQSDPLPTTPYYDHSDVESVIEPRVIEQPSIPLPRLQATTPGRLRAGPLVTESRALPPGAITGSITGGSLGPGQFPAGNNLAASSTQSRIPDILVETIGPPVIQVGQRATWQIRVTNQDTRPSGQVYLRIQLPSWLELTSNQTTAGDLERVDEHAGTLPITWQLPSIAAGSQETWDLELVPGKNKSFDLQLDWSVRPAPLSTSIRVVEPQIHLDIDGPGEMVYGQTSLFTVRLTNPGNGDAQGVILQLDPGGARQPIGTISAGGSRSLEIELTAEQAGQMLIRAVATAHGLDTVIAEQEILVRRPELKVSIHGPAQCFAGVPAAYRVEIENHGDAPADEVAIRASLPLGAQLVGRELINAADNTIAWAVGTVEAGTMRAFEFQCDFSREGSHPLHVRVTGDGVDPAVDSLTANVFGVADLKLDVNDPQGPRSLNEPAPFEIQVINRGTSPARDVSVIAHFDHGVEPIKVVGAKATLVPGQVLFDLIKEIGPGEKVVLTIHASASVEGRHRFRAEIFAGDPETRLVQEEMTWFLGK
jgi:hypothetical protein